MKSMRVELEILFFESPADWLAWLEENHASACGVWLRLAKKASSLFSVTYAEGVEGALCYGWIDGQSKKYDADSWLQKFTPRAKRSLWSKINRDKALQLIQDGAMQPAGLREVERAREDGRWDAAYDSPSQAPVPLDLQARLDASPAASECFALLSSQNRYAILFRLQTAKRPETRARRIEQFIAMLEQGEKLYP